MTWDYGQWFQAAELLRKLSLCPLVPSRNVETEGVSVVAPWLTNLTRIHEDVGLIPGLAQWVKDLALP